MAVEILVILTTKLGSVLRGHPKRFKETPCAWSTIYSPPRYVILRVTGATTGQVGYFLEPWEKYYAHTILNENDNGYRIRIEVDPNVISLSGLNKRIKSKFKQYIEYTWGGVTQSFGLDFIIFDIAKPVDLVQMKKEFADIFNVRFARRHFIFSETILTNAINAGGLLEITKAEALTDITNEWDR